MTGYVRFAALGDSTTLGIGDPAAGGWRGWARLLADSLGQVGEVSFCNVAASGATAADVRSSQLAEAVDHRPDIASLIVGINDTMRSSWEPARIRADLLTCAADLHRTGALLMTARFHDHGAVFGLPKLLRRPLQRRIEQINAVYDEIHDVFGGVRVDLGAYPEVHDRSFWSVDRLHPSQLGHRKLAGEYARRLRDVGFDVEGPSLTCDGEPPTPWDNARWMVTEGAPWIGRRAKDMGPVAVRLALTEARQMVRREPVGSSA